MTWLELIKHCATSCYSSVLQCLSCGYKNVKLGNMWRHKCDLLDDRFNLQDKVLNNELFYFLDQINRDLDSDLGKD